MTDQFVGQIIQVGFNFAPINWFTCQGQTLPISQYTTLFSLLGTSFGGNGTTNFQIPDFQGRTAFGVGQAKSGTIYDWGEVGGAEQVTLTSSNLPAHSHGATFAGTGGGGGGAPQITLNVSTAAATLAAPTAGAFLAQSADTAGQANPVIYVPAGTGGTQVALGGLSVTGGGGFTGGNVTVQNNGGSIPTPTLSPFLAVTFIIAYEGIYPSRP